VVLHDFVVKNRVIESETELDGVTGREFNLVSFFIGM
jgi:hypothetical protein